MLSLLRYIVLVFDAALDNDGKIITHGISEYSAARLGGRFLFASLYVSLRSKL